MMDIKEYILDKKKLIDTALDRCLPPAAKRPSIIHKAMRYAVFSGGKRIRPILTVAAFEACGGKGNSIMSVACAIELIHTYTLIHDDLPCMDNDDYRRGKLTCHKKFGEDIALLAGDALLTLAFQILSKSGNIKLIDEISKAIGTDGTIGGQVEDIQNQKSILRLRSGLMVSKAEPSKINPSTTLRIDGEQGRTIKNQKWVRDYINAKKTAALFSVAAKAGGIFKNALYSKIEALEKFGKDIGVAFQLVDDVIDNDGYVRLYGKDYARKRAYTLTQRAKDSVEIFGKNKAVLSGIASMMLYR